MTPFATLLLALGQRSLKTVESQDLFTLILKHLDALRREEVPFRLKFDEPSPKTANATTAPHGPLYRFPAPNRNT